MLYQLSYTRDGLTITKRVQAVVVAAWLSQ